MKNKLSEGVHLVVDRYAYSGVAFSAAKVNFVSPTPAKNLYALYARADILIFLHM